MWLEMRLDSINKKIKQSDMMDYDCFRAMKGNMEFYQSFMDGYEQFDSMRDFAVAKYAHVLKVFDEWLESRESNVYHLDRFDLDSVFSEKKTFDDFRTREALIDYCVSELQLVYDSTFEKMSEYKSGEYVALKNKFENVFEESTYQWCNHSDLNGYLTKLAEARGVADSMFNGQLLVLEKDDIELMTSMVNKQVDGEKLFEKTEGFFWGSSTDEHWMETASILNRILREHDFDNNTLFYSCFW